MAQTKEGDTISKIKRRITIFSDRERELNKRYDEKRTKLRKILLEGLGPESLQELMECNAYGPGLTKKKKWLPTCWPTYCQQTTKNDVGSVLKMTKARSSLESVLVEAIFIMPWS